jgi:hypothetical protein
MWVPNLPVAPYISTFNLSDLILSVAWSGSTTTMIEAIEKKQYESIFSTGFSLLEGGSLPVTWSSVKKYGLDCSN